MKKVLVHTHTTHTTHTTHSHSFELLNYIPVEFRLISRTCYASCVYLLARCPVVECSVGSLLSVTPCFICGLVRRARHNFGQRVCCSVRSHECGVGCSDFGFLDCALFFACCFLFWCFLWRLFCCLEKLVKHSLSFVF